MSFRWVTRHFGVKYNNRILKIGLIHKIRPTHRVIFHPDRVETIEVSEGEYHPPYKFEFLIERRSWWLAFHYRRPK